MYVWPFLYKEDKVKESDDNDGIVAGQAGKKVQVFRRVALKAAHGSLARLKSVIIIIHLVHFCHFDYITKQYNFTLSQRSITECKTREM